jgi:hypothetical protein
MGVDDRLNTNSLVQVVANLAPRAGTYTLDDKTPETCAVCVYVALGCGAQGCSEVYFATQGTAVITEMGDPGGRFTGVIREAGFMKLNTETGALTEPEREVCLQEHAFDVVMPAKVGYEVPEFALQSCATGEFERFSTLTAAHSGLWYIATAGWCPACRQHITELHGGRIAQLEEAGVKMMFVVTEDDSYEPATLEFCERYARRYTNDARNFYLDAGLDRTSANMSLYLNEDGSFGLPWNAVIEGGSGVMLHADGAGTDVNRALDQVTRP